MRKNARLLQIFYLIIALILLGVALNLWMLRQTPPSTHKVSEVIPTVTVAPALPTMGYGPLALTPIAEGRKQAATSQTATINNNAKSSSPLVATADADLSDRFGVIVTGLDGVADKAGSLKRLLDLTGAKWWYQYNQVAPDQPAAAQQVYMVKVDKEGLNGSNYKYWTDFLKNKSFQNSYWMIGNEPNVPGQDDTPPDVYAKTLHELTAAIKAADSNATVIGPNVLNWNYTCNGCPGYTPGQTWFEQMQTSYQSQFGLALPFAAYSMHTYSLDWNNLPLVNHNRDVEQIQFLRTYLDANPDTRNKPIWLSEFGVIWGYDALGWGKDANGNNIVLPAGNLRTDLISAYFNDTLSWLKANAVQLNLARWFIYTSYGLPEPYTNTFSGISLVDGTSPQANLTEYGKIYAKYLQGQ